MSDIYNKKRFYTDPSGQEYSLGYWDNGRLWIKAMWSNKNFHGPFQSWNRDGTTLLFLNYTDGEKDGERIQFEYESR